MTGHVSSYSRRFGLALASGADLVTIGRDNNGKIEVAE